MNSFCSFQCQRTEPVGWSWGQAWSGPPWDFYMLSTHSHTVTLGRLRRVRLFPNNSLPPPFSQGHGGWTSENIHVMHKRQVERMREGPGAKLCLSKCWT